MQTDRSIYRHCGDDKAGNVSRMAKHLLKCPRYQASLAIKTIIKHFKQSFKQITLFANTLTPQEKAYFDKLATYTVYYDIRPF